MLCIANKEAFFLSFTKVIIWMTSTKMEDVKVVEGVNAGTAGLNVWEGS
jgi:hypothetical protein